MPAIIIRLVQTQCHPAVHLKVLPSVAKLEHWYTNMIVLFIL